MRCRRGLLSGVLTVGSELVLRGSSEPATLTFVGTTVADYPVG